MVTFFISHLINVWPKYVTLRNVTFRVGFRKMVEPKCSTWGANPSFRKCHHGSKLKSIHLLGLLLRIKLQHRGANHQAWTRRQTHSTWTDQTMNPQGQHEREVYTARAPGDTRWHQWDWGQRHSWLWWHWLTSRNTHLRTWSIPYSVVEIRWSFVTFSFYL